jgi:cytochrome c nitrite reductase small subunit
MQNESIPAASREPTYAGRWLIALSVALGIAAGTGLYTFRYAEGLSYLSTDPRACMNCHIMRPQYDSWLKSSHHATAACIDCHLPHAFVDKYLAKLENGYRHSEKFTTQAFVEPIRVQPRGSAILQANCVRCHDALAHEIAFGRKGEVDGLACVHCHFGVGHGERTGVGPPLHYDAEADAALLHPALQPKH